GVVKLQNDGGQRAEEELQNDEPDRVNFSFSFQVKMHQDHRGEQHHIHISQQHHHPQCEAQQHTSPPERTQDQKEGGRGEKRIGDVRKRRSRKCVKGQGCSKKNTDTDDHRLLTRVTIGSGGSIAKIYRQQPEDHGIEKNGKRLTKREKDILCIGHPGIESLVAVQKRHHRRV